MRRLGLIIVPIGMFLLIHWFPLWFLLPFGYGTGVRTIVALVGAILVGRYMWTRRHGPLFPDGLLGSVLVGAVVTGGVAFLAGFLGPIIFAPEANQGPLLGIFITGPLGFILGGLGGGVYWAWRKQTPPGSG